ncbi:hypothetical protein BU24DRAFT_356352 [Aaosphaeria arxii CBS 175.79]|uniref:PH domain-containing protein n=1 Tax=Aaosphaeria arxii CBS 175.79 TaxID=1450172 RepID=A0A6A5XBR2_9PLEO|nr:uncharacterized protein BU24DRAFT_356352 [Aaosphaeria arxii CBS 175.79]KAF2010361.1 hypothetical protein BU24DRAFT_356352 [Aaosphaeria arxii CBS 175.79]
MSSLGTSRWRRNRSSMNLLSQTPQPVQPQPSLAPTPAPKLEKSSSKMSLFNLFSRPKVEKARGHIEVGLAVPMQPQEPPKPPPSPPKSSLRLNPTPSAQQVHRARSSGMLRPTSFRPSTATSNRDSGSWEPPPLFQAYPRSIKHATVQACVFSPDILLRTQSQRRQYELARERNESQRDLSATLEGSTEAKKLEKNHRRLISNSILHPHTPQLTDKVYVLDDDSHILQYAGDGPLDRLPEKVLKLGKESAAFACDLIPGKHWVLQISQSASEDGTVAIGPKHNLLSRLRLQSSSVRREATSFLLVLDSAEEMDSWMTTVRKQIDTLGGAKVKEETIRESSSIEESPEEHSESVSTPGQRYLTHRNPNRMSKAIDSPFQSLHSDSPRIVASDWEGNRSEKTISIADTTSIHSSGHSIKRRSVEASSIATTVISHDQLQLDQLRERSRLSYVSATTGTSISVAGTRNTSRNSSPAPQSPKEGISPSETPLTSLRSFHMIPSGATATRRRSMQPLPVTNEDSSLSAGMHSVTPQRHSIYGPTSPTLDYSGHPSSNASIPVSTHTPVSTFNAHAPKVTATDEQSHVVPTSAANFVRLSGQGAVRSSVRSSSAPAARQTSISPPPRDPAPPPGRRQSTLGDLPSSGKRMSQGQKPFLRPLPVRTQNHDGAVVVPRRYSSLSPAPIPLGVVVNRSATNPVKPPSAMHSFAPSGVNRAPLSSSPINEQRTAAPSSQPLRRPASVQIRSNPAPFLSSSRPVGAPVRAISSTPSFVPGKRASVAPGLRASPSNPALGLQNVDTASQRGVVPRRSMPAMAFPPPAPPPNMPLPPPPPVAQTRHQNQQPPPHPPPKPTPTIVPPSPALSQPLLPPPPPPLLPHRQHSPALMVHLHLHLALHAVAETLARPVRA